ncbi:hypothetical protein [Nitrosomonas sp.]
MERKKMQVKPDRSFVKNPDSLFAQRTTAGVIQRRMKNKLEYEPLETYRE